VPAGELFSVGSLYHSRRGARFANWAMEPDVVLANGGTSSLVQDG
jgi:hypothetical protein